MAKIAVLLKNLTERLKSEELRNNPYLFIGSKLNYFSYFLTILKIIYGTWVSDQRGQPKLAKELMLWRSDKFGDNDFLTKL